MTWRSLIISNPARLRIEHRALVVEQEAIARIPLEDIAIVVLDHPQITLSQVLLSRLGELGIALFAVSASHLPNGVYLSFQQHSRSTQVLRQQIRLTQPRKKQIQAIVISNKILNQGRCLAESHCVGSDHLFSLARQVRSGDKGHLESQAARFYFKALFGDSFLRRTDHPINAALNYGYAIFRGAIARGIVSHGLHPALGIFHDNEQNAFNLADDLLEPFRPLVDCYVASLELSSTETFGSEHKPGLVSLLNVVVEMNKEKVSALVAIDTTVKSLLRIVQGRNGASDLLMPTLRGLNQAEQEI